MKLRHIFPWLLGLVLLATTSPILTACSSDDDDNNNSGGNGKEQTDSLTAMYDDLEFLQRSLCLIDSAGKLVRYEIGEAIQENDPQHRYIGVTELKAADIRPLTQLERIALPMPLDSIEENSFANAKGLRWADFMLCDSTVIDQLRNGGLRNVGLSESTLCFMPSEYGESQEVNVIVGDTTSTMRCATYRLEDGRDYDVPYAFKADKVENTRTLAKSTAPYTICLPYDLPVPNSAKAYKLSGRSSTELIFTQTLETLEALQPYLIWTANGDALLNTGAADIPTSGGQTYGRQHDAPGFSMRGTLYGISNAEAAELGAYTLQQDGLWHPVLSDTDAHRAASILPYRAYLLENRILC